MSILVWTSRNRHVEWDPDPKPRGPFLALPERVADYSPRREYRKAFGSENGVEYYRWATVFFGEGSREDSIGVIVTRAYPGMIYDPAAWSGTPCWCCSGGSDPSPETCPAGDACAFGGDGYAGYVSDEYSGESDRCICGNLHDFCVCAPSEEEAYDDE